MKRAGPILLLVLFIWASSYAQNGPRPKWKLLSIAGDTITYIQTRRVVTRQGTVRLWVKLVRLAQDDIGSKILTFKNMPILRMLSSFGNSTEEMKL